MAAWIKTFTIIIVGIIFILTYIGFAIFERYQIKKEKQYYDKEKGI